MPRTIPGAHVIYSSAFLPGISPPAASVEVIPILKRVEGVILVSRPFVLPLSALSTPDHILMLLLAPVNGMRQAARVQVALRGMTVVQQ